MGVQSLRVLLQSAAGREALGGRRGSDTPPLACGSCFEKSLLSFSFTFAVVCQFRQFKPPVWLKLLVVFGLCDDSRRQ